MMCALKWKHLVNTPLTNANRVRYRRDLTALPRQCMAVLNSTKAVNMQAKPKANEKLGLQHKKNAIKITNS